MLLVANEVINLMGKNKDGDLFLKVDFEKAYDTIDWGFLDFILNKIRFGERWTSWVKSCVTTVEVSILVNGSPTRQFLAMWQRFPVC